MPEKSHYTIIRGEAAQSLPSLKFDNFAERPVNYHRDILADGHAKQEQHRELQSPAEDIREAVHRETAKQRHLMEEQVKTQIKEAVARTRAEAEQEFNKAIDLLTSYGRILQSEKEELTSRYEREALDLAFDLAGKILGEHLAEHPEAIAKVARQALQQVIDCSKITVRVNPSDLNYLQNLRADLASQISQETRFELISDKSIEPGGCVLDTEKGSLDARIASQLDTMKNSLSTATGA